MKWQHVVDLIVLAAFAIVFYMIYGCTMINIEGEGATITVDKKLKTDTSVLPKKNK